MTETPNKPKAILLSRACDISAFASTDDSRYVLNGVHFNAEKKCVEATDGRIAIRVPVLEVDGSEFPNIATDQAKAPKDVIVPTDSFKKAMAGIPKGATLPILRHAKLDTNENGTRAFITATNLDRENSVLGKTTEGTYPKLDTVLSMNDAKPTVLSIILSGEYLAMIGSYAAKHGQGGSIHLKFAGPEDAMQFTVTLDDNQEAIGLLMPKKE